MRSPLPAEADMNQSRLEIQRTADGRAFVRTPDECFRDLPGFPFEPHYVEIDGLRQHYVDEGPRDGPPVLLVHGEPSWSYLYRKMIPLLAATGHRVIAPDLLGMGRSDKWIAQSEYSYEKHVGWLQQFVQALGLRRITFFGQDWGGLIGLRVVLREVDRFDRIAAANTAFPVLPEGLEISIPESRIDPEMKRGFDFRSVPQGTPVFLAWVRYALQVPDFRASEVVDRGTFTRLSPRELAAYDAPFPEEIAKAAPRVFPSLVLRSRGAPHEEWLRLQALEKPFLTLWAPGDPILGEWQPFFVDNVKGAKGQPHAIFEKASHFLQEDVGEELARHLIAFIAAV
jgi:haloalkane dehalogenase